MVAITASQLQVSDYLKRLTMILFCSLADKIITKRLTLLARQKSFVFGKDDSHDRGVADSSRWEWWRSSSGWDRITVTSICRLDVTLMTAPGNGDGSDCGRARCARGYDNSHPNSAERLWELWMMDGESRIIVTPTKLIQRWWKLQVAGVEKQSTQFCRMDAYESSGYQGIE